ncbi:MAG: CAP domain-containing protein [Actinomycetota bacterium]
MRRKISLLLALALLALALPMATGADASSGCWSYRLKERRFAAKINKARTSRGLGSVKLDAELSRVARLHTNEMVKAERLHHTSMTTLGRRVTNWVTLGENVGVGQTVTTLHSAFMDSPAHRDNVLFNTYNHVGVGTKQVGDRLWVTVIFEAHTNPGTILEMPTC